MLKKIAFLLLVFLPAFAYSQTIYSFQHWADGGQFDKRIYLPHDSTNGTSDIIFIGGSIFGLGTDGHYHNISGGGTSGPTTVPWDSVTGKPNISAVGLTGQWLDILNRPTLIQNFATNAVHNDTTYNYPSWIVKLAWATLYQAPDSNTYGYHTLGYYWPLFNGGSAFDSLTAQLTTWHSAPYNDARYKQSSDSNKSTSSYTTRGHLYEAIDSLAAITGSASTESILGPIYGKSNWTSLADFTTNGATASTSGGHIILGCSTCGTYTESLDLTGGTLLEHGTITVFFKPNFTPGGATYGFAAGFRSTNTIGPSNAYAAISLTNTSTAGQALLVGGASNATIDTSDTRLTWSNGNQLAMTLDRIGNGLNMQIRNVTTNSLPIKVEHSLNSQDPPTTANVGRFSMLVLGGGPYEIDSIVVSSTETVGANVMVVGDSKSVTYYPDNFTSGWTSVVATSNPDMVIHAGGSDKIEDVLNTTDEIRRLAPKQILLAIGSNSIREPEDSTVYDVAYDTLVNRLTAAGIRVIHLLPFAETPGTGTGVDVSPLVRHILSKYLWANIIDTYTPLVGVAGAINSTDGTHPTDLGHHIIGNIILASGKINGSKTTQDFSVIQSQTAHVQNAGFNLGGNEYKMHGPVTVGNRVEEIPQFIEELSPDGQIQHYGVAGTMYILGLNKKGAYGAPISITASSLDLGSQTTGFQKWIHIDSNNLLIGKGSGISSSLITSIGKINVLDFAGEQILESSDAGRTATVAMRLTGTHVAIGNQFTGAQMAIFGVADTNSLNVRTSYTGNFGNSFTLHSVIDKNYADSALKKKIDSLAALISAGNYQTVQAAGSSVAQQPKLNFLAPFIVANNGGNSSTDISLPTAGAIYTGSVSLSNSTNITTSSVLDAVWTKSGNIIHVKITALVTPTTTGLLTGLSFNLPATEGTMTDQYCGTGVQIATAGIVPGYVILNSSTGATSAEFLWTTNAITSVPVIIELDYPQ